MRVIVTGSASGIGIATMEAVRARGWEAIGFDIKGDSPVDVQRADAVRQAVSQAWLQGPVTGVVCAAGILLSGTIDDTEFDDWDRILGINFFGTVNVLRALSHLWRDSGHRGSAVVVSSMAGERGMKGSVAYCASKAALNGLVRAVALDWAPKGHRINAILPGSVDTPMLRRFAEEAGLGEIDRINSIQPLGRVAQPREIATICCFLLASESSYITGATIAADGALTLGYG